MRPAEIIFEVTEAVGATGRSPLLIKEEAIAV